MATEASAKADIDSDVRMRDIASQSIPSEVKIAADQMRSSQSAENGTASKPGFMGRLNPASQAKFRYVQQMADKVVSYMRHDRRDDAHRNFDTNMEKAVNGTTLDVPTPMRDKVQGKPAVEPHRQAQDITLER